jgi:predicted nucleic acid-binding protein
MIAYFDSSVLLTILLNEEQYDKACSLWSNAEFCLSSFLLRIETNISLNRSHKISVHKDDDFWLSQKMNELYGMLNDIHCKPIDSSIEQIIIQNKKLAGCRSLDAIHIATALYFRENSREQNITLYSFDKNMLAIAKQFGFETN